MNCYPMGLMLFTFSKDNDKVESNLKTFFINIWLVEFQMTCVDKSNEVSSFFRFIFMRDIRLDVGLLSVL